MEEARGGGRSGRPTRWCGVPEAAFSEAGRGMAESPAAEEAAPAAVLAAAGSGGGGTSASSGGGARAPSAGGSVAAARGGERPRAPPKTAVRKEGLRLKSLCRSSLFAPEGCE